MQTAFPALAYAMESRFCHASVRTGTGTSGREDQVAWHGVDTYRQLVEKPV